MTKMPGLVNTYLEAKTLVCDKVGQKCGGDEETFASKESFDVNSITLTNQTIRENKPYFYDFWQTIFLYLVFTLS